MYAPQIPARLVLAALTALPAVGGPFAPSPLVQAPAGQDPADQGLADQDPGSGESAGVDSAPDPAEAWAELLARDARVSFTARSAFDAREALEDPDTPAGHRPAALMAIGCAEPQAIRERPLLEAWAREGDRDERAAALLALGEFGEGGEALLLEGLEDPDTLLRGAALVGLSRGARRSSRLRVELVAEGDGPDARLAAAALVFALDPAGSSPNPVLRRLLELRWDAARRYGLVDGRSWRARLLEELGADPRFLDAVVFLSASAHTNPGVKDHLLAALLERPREATLRAAARAMPDELARMIEAGLWAPAGPAAWRVLLDEVDLTRGEERALGLLAQALRAPDVSVEAVRLLARAGVTEPVVGLELVWPRLSAADRCRAAQAWAFAREADALEWLEAAAGDPDPGVRAHALLARARLGDADAHASFRSVLADPEHADHATLVAAALEQSDAALVRAHLEEHLEDLPEAERVDALATLALRGVALARLALAEELRAGFPPGERGVRCVRALLVQEPSEFAELLRGAFPVEDDLQLNVALGLALVAARDDLALRFLRRAVWDDAWDRSVLAALVLRTVGGPGSLRDEVHRIPREASSRDLRRLGFAIGEWGGLEAIEHLQQRENLLMRSPVLQGALLGALGRRTH